MCNAGPIDTATTLTTKFSTIVSASVSTWVKLMAVALLVVTPLTDSNEGLAAPQNQFDFSGSAAQGGPIKHQFTVKQSARHLFRLNWNQSVNANLVISDANGGNVLVLDTSKPGERIESGSKWLTAGQRLTATIYIQKHANLNYSLDIDADITGGDEPRSGGATFQGRISQGQQIWHYYRLTETARHQFTLNWTQDGADADIVLSKLNGDVIARAASSGTTRKSETMGLDLTRGQQYYVKVFVRRGQNVSYNLSISTSGSGSSSSGSGSGSGSKSWCRRWWTFLRHGLPAGDDD